MPFENSADVKAYRHAWNKRLGGKSCVFDSASASVSRGMAASQLHFCKPSQSPSQEPLVLLDQYQVYQLLQRLRTTEHLYYLGPPLQFLDQPFQLVGGVKVGPDTFGMVQELREGLLSNHLATSSGYFPAHFGLLRPGGPA